MVSSTGAPDAETKKGAAASCARNRSGNTTVTFHYYYSGTATITIHQGTTTGSVTVAVAAGSSTSVTFKTPPGFLVTAVLTPQAYATVSGLPRSNSVNVAL